MRAPVIKAFLLDFGLVSTGQRVTSTFQVHAPSDAEVTAVMVQNDTGSFKVQQVVAYNVTKDPVDPGVPGAPANTIEVAVPHYHSASAWASTAGRKIRSMDGRRGGSSAKGKFWDHRGWHCRDCGNRVGSCPPTASCHHQVR